MKNLLILFVMLCLLNVMTYGKEKSVEIYVNGGYSIITHEKSIFWDNGYNYGLGINYYLNEDIHLGINASYTAYYPLPDYDSPERRYEYEIYPLIISLNSKLGELNDLEIYGGFGISYIYGEYQVDDIQTFTDRTNIIFRNKYASNGFGFIPSLKVRSPFGNNVAVDAMLDYNLIFMESKNNAELSLDHINIKLALVYIF